ncbi:2-hydroxychromene-2-carboxylate isomerase [Aquabacterium sp.]|uniref:2-hydroxychromene-2-carboxylate isomerase n=1 Tax=Aquabacterium sp. TaxID=1872578 RepID=UPI002C2FCABE|nr:2-hydroxychromene-2-carboxylate isomerase [Aquabacterium sp.]HSW07996.1 2-hydroxychromene-2-carboxylate isomerase [Aquabacterium sp.]
MPPVHVKFLFDFGSPNAYLCHKVIPAIEARTGAVFEYVPILLGGLFKLSNNRSPGEAFAGIPNKQAYDRMEITRFVARHGLSKYRFNPHFPVNTLKIMRGACAAQKFGCLPAYVDVVYAAMWEDGRNMDDLPTLTATLDAGGLDSQAILALSQDPEVKATLLANTQSAHDHGAFGSPSFLIGRELWFGKDRLGDVEEAILAGAAS